MAGIKIINILKDDSLADILDVFRSAPAGEVIFVLPKNGKIFRSDDHFAAFAGEASSAGKTISILTTNSDIAARARAHGFNVMVSATTKRVRKPKAVTAATYPPPSDPEIQDPSEDAFEEDVPLTSDERQQVTSPDDADAESDIVPGFHVEGTEGEEPVTNQEVEADADLAMVRTKKPATAVSPTEDSFDYIDKVWRDRAAQQGTIVPRPRSSPLRRLRFPGASIAWLTRKTVIALLIGAVLIVGIVVYLTAGSAVIAVAPASQPVDEHIAVSVSGSIASVDATFGNLPGQLLEMSKSATHSVAATGSRDVASKAKGTLTVYNGYSSTPQTLIATTRFTAPNGLVFRTLSTVTVPGSTVVKGSAVPGSVTVSVIADKPGTDYNIAAGKFTIAAFVEKGDTDRAAKIYGVSTAPMSGGANGPSAVVTQADYDAAKTAATSDVAALIADALKSQTGGMRIADDAPGSTPTFTSDAQPDDAAASVSVTATVTLKTVAFRQADLDKLIADTILRKDRLNVQADQLTVKLSNVAYDDTLQKLTFTADVTGNGYDPVDAAGLATAVKGMDTAAFQQYVGGRDDIQQATLTLRPFWVSHLPADTARIQVDFVER
ncbi:MAG TPA: hypothetical protein VMU12_00425 [Candidatus Paceibacterota bacterium]|nr:hypothetical protein [Candidatus Paceibacterota bacterium]